MKKTLERKLPQVLEKSEMPPIWQESRFVEWITQNGKYLLLGFLAAISLLFVIYHFNNRESVKPQLDYFNMSRAFQTFAGDSSSKGKNDEPSKQAALEQFNQILHRHPELHAKYDGMIAQILINRDDVEMAKPFADKVFSRINHEGIDLYKNYSEITLLMSAKKYKEALAESIQLKEAMLEKSKDEANKSDVDLNFGQNLYAANLLRIAFLHQELKMQDQELKSWKEWQEYLSLRKEKTQDLSALLDSYKQGSFSLEDYIKVKEKALGNK